MSRLHPSRPSGALQSLGRALREWPGWFTLAAGALLCVLGWYGVSGERLPARQLPYLASATVPGAALIVAGAVLIAARQSGAGGDGTARRVDQLYSLLVGEPGPAGPQPGPPGPPLALPDGTLYHRPDCPLVAGKTLAAPADAALVAERSLAPCPVCEPDPPAGPPAAAPPAAGPPADPPAAATGG
ncbi:hypothetical protein GCM10018781_18480 [Kitasatospora indigofera]|uniref:Uncharacterized protein n=1 Tax=Kitasatospora indigofera TaxID=67307 RepID=A0A919FI34_9ACTN|nr:hypothetical protein [Kitasatospora indigofera]GHH65651.1 hypothetical protein GCM10018781_18480 [Kitasatospora indigofera]